MKIQVMLLLLLLLTGCAKSKDIAARAARIEGDTTAVDSDTPSVSNSSIDVLPEEKRILLESRYAKSDSVRIEQLLSRSRSLPDSTNWMLYFGRQFIGIPYVAKTLDREMDEHLVVNTRELDCTTFVETVLALHRCRTLHKYSFADFLGELRSIRYLGGEMAYVNRQHYFTVWINDNKRMKIVDDVQSPVPPFTAVQHLSVNWMTTHSKDYPQLAAHPEWLGGIRKMEQSITGKSYRYIPKGSIANTRLFRQTIHDGDILVILTSKSGLDTSHIGIAVWHKDGLHLLNASYLRHKVVEESKTLYLYMQGQRSQTGIRVCRAR